MDDTDDAETRRRFGDYAKNLAQLHGQTLKTFAEDYGTEGYIQNLPREFPMLDYRRNFTAVLGARVANVTCAVVPLMTTVRNAMQVSMFPVKST